MQKETEDEREKDYKVRIQSHRQQTAQISSDLSQQTSPITLNTKEKKTLGDAALSTRFCIRPYARLSGEQKWDHHPLTPLPLSRQDRPTCSDTIPSLLSVI